MVIESDMFGCCVGKDRSSLSARRHLCHTVFYRSIDRQKRLDHQREYAEALRRDMATPKVDSLGR